MVSFLLRFKEISEFNANSVDPHQMQHSVAFSFYYYYVL